MFGIKRMMKDIKQLSENDYTTNHKIYKLRKYLGLEKSTQNYTAIITVAPKNYVKKTYIKKDTEMCVTLDANNLIDVTNQITNLYPSHVCTIKHIVCHGTRKSFIDDSPLMGPLMHQ